MRRFGRDARGQSLVETALVLPLLLLLVLGIADLGRFAQYGIAVSHATREAAAYAARDPGVTGLDVRDRVCRELNLGSSECATIEVVCRRGPATLGGAPPESSDCEQGRPAAAVSVSVRLDLPLLTGAITERLGMDRIPLRGAATFAGYTQ